MKNLLAFALICSVALAAADLESLGCYENTAGQWYCPEPIKAFDITADFEDILCFSSADDASCTGADCASVVDLGCYSIIAVTEPRSLEVCFALVNASTIEKSVECENYSLETNGSYVASINPGILDFSACDKYVENGTFTVQCPYAGKRLSFDAMVTEDAFIIPAFKETPSIASTLSQNAVYIILAAVACVIAFLVLKEPAKRKTR